MQQLLMAVSCAATAAPATLTPGQFVTLSNCQCLLTSHEATPPYSGYLVHSSAALCKSARREGASKI